MRELYIASEWISKKCCLVRQRNWKMLECGPKFFDAQEISKEQILNSRPITLKLLQTALIIVLVA